VSPTLRGLCHDLGLLPGDVQPQLARLVRRVVDELHREDRDRVEDVVGVRDASHHARLAHPLAKVRAPWTAFVRLPRRARASHGAYSSTPIGAREPRVDTADDDIEHAAVVDFDSEGGITVLGESFDDFLALLASEVHPRLGGRQTRPALGSITRTAEPISSTVPSSSKETVIFETGEAEGSL
jgi:hypothetical protein